MDPSYHDRCNHAWKQVTCDRCHRSFQCTPSDDFYCTEGPEHVCERCLISGAGFGPGVFVPLVPTDGGQ